MKEAEKEEEANVVNRSINSMLEMRISIEEKLGYAGYQWRRRKQDQPTVPQTPPLQYILKHLL